MQTNITGHHIEVTPALRAYVTEKLQRISRHFDHVISIDVILKVENHSKFAEGKINAAGTGKALFAQESDDERHKGGFRNMLISDLLSAERIRCDVHVSSKKRLLEIISEELARNSDQFTQREIFESL